MRPWVPRLPDLPPAVSVGERITLGLVVVQDSTFPTLWGAFAAAFVGAVRQLEEWGFGDLVAAPGGPTRRGALSVGRVRWLHPSTGETQPFVYTEDAPIVPPFFSEGSEFNVPRSEQGQSHGEGDVRGRSNPAAVTQHSALLRVSFLTPTRLTAGEAVLRTPEPGTLVQRIVERVEAVCAGVRVVPPADLDTGAVVAAGRLQIVANETRWAGSDKRGGLQGTVTYGGTADDLAAVLPALRWGQILGVGKGAQNGAGRIEIVDAPR